MTNALFAFAFGFLPAAVAAGTLAGIGWWFRPPRYGIHAFLAGAIGASFVALAGLMVFRQATAFLGETIQFTLIWLVYGPVAEETVKVVFLAGLVGWAVHRGEAWKENWALYGALVGLGLAGAEGFVLLFEETEQEWTMTQLLTRWLGTAQMHALATAVAGLMLGLGQGYGRVFPVFHLGGGLAAAIMVHGLWNCVAGGLYATESAGFTGPGLWLMGVMLFGSTVGLVVAGEVVIKKKERYFLT